MAEPTTTGDAADGSTGAATADADRGAASLVATAVAEALRAVRPRGGRGAELDGVVGDERWRTGVVALAERLGRPVEEVAAEAAGDAAELVTAQEHWAIRAMHALTDGFYRRAWRLDVDDDALARLRAVPAGTSLVFLPTHRSYADSMILNGLLRREGFGRNRTFGGANLSFWPLGPVGRRSGIIFIRRSFGDDEVYKFAVGDYVGHLAAVGANLEWYLEGGRSRTGKLREPRFGMLAYLAAAVSEGRADDVALVPMSTTYDHLGELPAMADEERGTAKAAEGLRWLTGYLRLQRTLGGTAHVRFGEVRSLRELLERAAADGLDPRAALERVAFDVYGEINATIPVTAVSLVTLVLLASGRACTDGELAAGVAPWLAYLRGVDAPLADAAVLDDPAERRAVLDALVRDGLVEVYAGGIEPVWSIAPGRRLEAAFFRNSSIHRFVDRALVEVALVQSMAAAPGPALVAAATERVDALRALLAFEFFFPRRPEHLDDLAAEAERIAPGLVGGDRGDDARTLLGAADVLVAPVVLRPFLEALYVLADRLVASPTDADVDHRALVDACRGVGQQLVRQGRLRDGEAVAGDLFDDAWALARRRQLTRAAPDPAAAAALLAARAALLDEVVAALAALDELEALGGPDRRLAAAARGLGGSDRGVAAADRGGDR